MLSSISLTHVHFGYFTWGEGITLHDVLLTKVLWNQYNVAHTVKYEILFQSTIFFIEKTCGLPPVVANAEPSRSGSFPVGHTHNYKCTVGYAPFYELYTTSQDYGKWTDVIFECISMLMYLNFTDSLCRQTQECLSIPL